jgi:hypothetical protein
MLARIATCAITGVAVRFVHVKSAIRNTGWLLAAASATKAGSLP